MPSVHVIHFPTRTGAASVGQAKLLSPYEWRAAANLRRGAHHRIQMKESNTFPTRTGAASLGQAQPEKPQPATNAAAKRSAQLKEVQPEEAQPAEARPEEHTKQERSQKWRGPARRRQSASMRRERGKRGNLYKLAQTRVKLIVKNNKLVKLIFL